MINIYLNQNDTYHKIWKIYFKNEAIGDFFNENLGEEWKWCKKK